MKTTIISVLVLSTSIAFAQPTFTVQDLGTFRPNDTNIHGDLVGEQDNKAVICFNNHPCFDLSFGKASSINDQRQVVGSHNFGGWVLWPDGNGKWLPTEHAGAFTEPTKINNNGAIIGQHYGACGDFACQPIKAFVSFPPYDTIQLFGNDGATAWDINDHDIIAGSNAFNGITTHAMNCIAHSLECFDLGSFQGRFHTEGFGTSQAFGINNANESVGWSTHVEHFLIGVWHAWRRSASGLQLLGTRPNWAYSVTHSVNDHGEKVGRASVRLNGDDQREEAVYWSSDGIAFMLSDLLSADGWQLVQAGRIVNDGRILALGFHNGQFKGALLRPMNNPSFHVSSNDCIVLRGRELFECLSQ